MATSHGTTLSGLRLAIGGAAWAAPNRTADLFGLDSTNNPTSSFLARLFGVRDIALGVSALRSTGASRRLAWQLGILCDLFDAAAALLARRNRTLATRAALMAGATALAAAALGAA